MTDSAAAPGTVAYGTATGRWVLAATVLGSAMGFLDATVVNVALPAIGEDLDADVSALQWVLDSYLLTLAALILLGGSLADRYGRRRVFSAGVVCFMLPSVLCAFAPTAEVLIIARGLQGVGAALLTPGSLAIIQAAFRPADRSRAIGAWSALSGVAAALGPIVGGYLIDALSWRWIFLINVPIGLAVLAATARHVPESRDPTVAGKLDLRGGLLATLGLGCLTYALIEGPRGETPVWLVGAALLLGLVALAAFARCEQRSRDPMLPFGVFASRQFLAANAVTVVVYAALGGVFFLLVVFLQTSLGYSPLLAGAASLPVTLLMLLLSARAGQVAQRVGPRVPLTVGPLLLACGMLLMLRIEAGDGYVSAVLPAVLVFGLGLATTVAPVTATALAAAPAEHSGVASGINNAVSRVAQLAAVAALPPLAGVSGADFTDPGALTGGFHTAMAITAALAAAGGLLAFATIRSDVLEETAEPERAPAPAEEPAPHPPHVAHEPCPYECPMAGAPLRPPPEHRSAERE